MFMARRTRIQKENPSWTDEELFQAARRWLIATLQKIIFYDFLPALIGEEVKPYTKYMPHVPPGISHAFAAAAFRFPHSIVPPAMILRKNVNACEFREEVGGFPALRLCQNWWNAQDIVQEYTVDEIILGMASQVSEADDIIVVEDLRDYIFGPMHFTRLDVVASSIMRGRDNGLPSYNMLRKTFNLPERTWETINPELYKTKRKMFEELAALYGGDINYLDAYVGGMLEVDNGPGELFKAIIRDQFERLRDSDRFWFENRQNGLFTDKEIDEIRKTTLRDIIRETTEISDQWLQEDVFYFKEGDPCPQPFQVNATGLEQCVPFMRFDHFTGNEVTYIFTLIGLGCIPLICFGIGYMLVQRRRRMGWDSSYDDLSATAIDVDTPKNGYHVPAFEWLQECHVRQVIVEISPGSLIVRKPRGGVLRKIVFSENAKVTVFHSEQNACGVHGPYCLLRMSKTHDLVLRLPSDKHLPDFLAALTLSLKKLNGQLTCISIPNKVLLEKAETEECRQRRLDHFFREAYARAFNQPKLSDSNTHESDTDSILDQTITKHELAQAIGMRETDMFVQRMFAITSHSSSDMVTFAEFLEVLKKFNEGTPRDKYKLLFAMCDVHGRGRVRRCEFAELIRSLNDVIGVRITESTHDNVIESILNKSGVSPSSEYLTAADFEAIFAQVDERRPVCVDFRGAKIKVNLEETASLSSFAVTSTPERQCLPHDIFGSFAAYVETYRQHIAILFIFCCVNIIVFLERFWHYRYETEHRDLRRVMGAGIAITRGAAGALSFCMAVVLLTVCRNVITLLRETPLGEFIPFDSAITFHKIVALFAAFWASLHTVGHCVNFYHVATQSQEGLHCLFQEAVFGSNFLPSICYWFYGTITGLTGILLVAVMSIIYVFALPCFMKRAYHAFRLTHLLNVAFYALTVLHGLPKLLDSPKFGYYVAGPVIIFVIDRIMGMRQEYKKLRILNAELLPSDIIYLQFKRPLSFSFRSGQWVRISSPAFSCAFNECHAFSLASAPQSPTLELYIKVVGPWTWKLRSEIIRAQANCSPYPLVHMNGPYGDGNQEWTNYEVAVLIGGGIGVTPYASTLTDLVLETTSGRHHNIKCRKVYFLWICPSHKNYEWFVDVLKDVEDLDQNRLIEGHIFVTQFFHKFDLRTTLLYICEKHFRGDHQGKSMFTGLRAHNHFGRPNFDAFFSYIQNVHNEISDIGVFSCGPSNLNDQISSACSRANRARNAPSLMHKFETF
ncbi:BLI-3 blue-light-inducible Bli-3 protein [Parelaphostrongylus tenuis]|uniref:NAD(P)H oxidase (H2O2-forming) n=1 Tax=Parelaphostrongylus tenuis TaxID=148309 RepID=A0AAD5MHI6_PARTN|nr:BLI-3 blue-light-inducible Bli-3 protein [Parelaphostrongylus tenuis]